MEVQFYPVIPGIYTPQKADKSALGTLPTRGFRFCEPLRLASGFGWYAYPPCDLAIQWDGTHGMQLWVDGTAMPEFGPGHAIQFPNMRAMWNAEAPAALVNESYPMMIRAVHELNMVQIWTGCLARTPPEWGLLIRPLVNVPAAFGLTVYEGYVETDRWFGPLFTNLFLTRTDVRLEIPKGRPLFQIQPVERAAMVATSTLTPLSDWTEAEWRDYTATVVAPNRDPQRQRGAYAIHSRQRPVS